MGVESYFPHLHNLLVHNPVYSGSNKLWDEGDASYCVTRWRFALNLSIDAKAILPQTPIQFHRADSGNQDGVSRKVGKGRHVTTPTD